MNFEDKLQEAFEAGYLQGLSESVIIDTTDYESLYRKLPKPNKSGGWQFGTKPNSLKPYKGSPDIIYTSPINMPYKEAKKEAEKIAKKKGLKKIYLQWATVEVLDRYNRKTKKEGQK